MPVPPQVRLPGLPLDESPNQSPRNPVNRVPHLVVVHAWGNPPATTAAEARARFGGNVRYMQNPATKVSAHVVYGGTLADRAGAAVQLVPWNRKAWTEAALNSAGYSVESADAIWHELDPRGAQQLARIVAFICHKTGIPPVWQRDMAAPGVCRHLDTGALGNPNHHVCPTGDEQIWRRFMAQVGHEFARGGFRPSWGVGVLRHL